MLSLGFDHRDNRTLVERQQKMPAGMTENELSKPVTAQTIRLCRGVGRRSPHSTWTAGRFDSCVACLPFLDLCLSVFPGIQFCAILRPTSIMSAFVQPSDSVLIIPKGLLVFSVSFFGTLGFCGINVDSSFLS